MPIVIIIIPVFMILSFLSQSPDNNEEENGYVEREYIEEVDKHVTVMEAKKILKLRLAKGEISAEEYSERMARL